jgi:glycosyltransferase involved in cell wall biosynthesis
MNIAHVSAHYRPVIGGQEVYIANLIEVCRQAGHSSMVYQLDRGEKATDAVCLPRLPYLARFIHGIDRKWLNWMISAFQPRGLFEADSVICHYAYHAPPLERIRERTIILSHGVEWRVSNQSRADIECEENAKHCLGRFKHVVNDTHYLRHLGVDAPAGKGFFTEVTSGVWFIPNCVDTDHFCPGDGLDEFRDQQLILVPRQMVEIRGIHLAIEAFHRISGDFPALKMCLLGKRHKSAAGYIARLDGMIRDYGLEQRVFFSDPVPNRDMPKWFNSAVVTLVPTLEKEGTSLSALESMSCGTATVTTNVAGLADLPALQCEPEASSMEVALREALLNHVCIGQEQRSVVNNVFNMKNWTRGWLQALAADFSK